MSVQPNGWLGAVVASVAIFLPAFLYVFADLPWWDTLRRVAALQMLWKVPLWAVVIFSAVAGALVQRR